MKLIFGKYIFRDSWIHRFDGRFKFASYILLLSLIFLKLNFISYFFLLFFFLFIFCLAKLPKILLWKISLFLLFFLFLINLININSSSVTKKGVIWSWNFLALSYSGIAVTFYYSLRVFLVILLTVILITTIKPKVLTLSIESLLKPLKLIRFPTHIFSMIISLTLRLVPTLIQEANNIMLAQASRGLDFRNSNLKNKLKALISLLIPLIISIFKCADEMAIAMESRGYDPFKKRTRYQQFILSRCNFLIFGVVFLVFFTIISYLYWINGGLSNMDFILNRYINEIHT